MWATELHTKAIHKLRWQDFQYFYPLPPFLVTLCGFYPSKYKFKANVRIPYSYYYRIKDLQNNTYKKFTFRFSFWKNHFLYNFPEFRPCSDLFARMQQQFDYENCYSQHKTPAEVEHGFNLAVPCITFRGMYALLGKAQCDQK